MPYDSLSVARSASDLPLRPSVRVTTSGYSPPILWCIAYSCSHIVKQYPKGAPGTATSESPVRPLSPVWILSACFIRITSNRLSLGLSGRLCPGLSLAAFPVCRSLAGAGCPGGGQLLVATSPRGTPLISPLTTFPCNLSTGQHFISYSPPHTARVGPV